MTDTSAVLLYGFEIPFPDLSVNHLVRIFGILRETGLAKADIQYQFVGPLDAEKLYLTARYYEATISEALGVELDDSDETRARWDGLLNKAARSLGEFEHDAPGWLLLVREL